jgi:nitroimidazol reductase NimA-like FMN-containing flavoprotein (pyridoxamine 5'-phosphate oxidase superfamily)
LLKVDAMSLGESKALLLRVGYGHLGCSRDNHPYVVPMHYAYDSECLYFFTTEGTKTEYMAANSEVCFQVEEVTDPLYWRSVMVIGRAERITKDEELKRAIELIKERNPTLTPAINETRIGSWRRLNKIAVYRLHPEALYGRKTI